MQLIRTSREERMKPVFKLISERNFAVKLLKSNHSSYIDIHIKADALSDFDALVFIFEADGIKYTLPYAFETNDKIRIKDANFARYCFPSYTDLLTVWGRLK